MANRHGTAGNLLDHGKDLPNADPPAGADVEDLVRSWLDRVQRPQLRLGDIRDVGELPDRRTIPIDLDVWGLPSSDGERFGDQAAKIAVAVAADCAAGGEHRRLMAPSAPVAAW